MLSTDNIHHVLRSHVTEIGLDKDADPSLADPSLYRLMFSADGIRHMSFP